MFKNLFKKDTSDEKFQNFLEGKLIKLEDVPDEVFSTKMMGDGYAIEPLGGEVLAPISGTIESLFPTGHALGLKGSDGSEILIHLGIDTVQLEGLGFTIHTRENAKVNQGDLLISVDWNLIKDKGYNPISMLVFTSGERIKLKTEGEIIGKNEEDFIEIEK